MRPDFTDDVGDFLWREFTAYCREETAKETEVQPEVESNNYDKPEKVDHYFFNE